MPFWDYAGLTLECQPPLPEHIARPWDSADELLLSEADASLPTLIINDRYGALQCALPSAHVWHDSAAAQTAAHSNRLANNRTASGRSFTDEQDIPGDTLQVLIKVPKTFELLQFWLYQCQQRLPDTTRYLLAGMSKHWPVSWLQWLQQHSRHYEQSQIRKKARLVSLQPGALPAPALWRSYVFDGMELGGLPGVFARERADIGSQVLLQQLPEDIAGTVCDLGCGNGLLGLTLARRYPLSQLIMTDDSRLAVRSARRNADHAGIKAQVVQGDCLEAVSITPDWIVCNPPFHDGHKQLTNIATGMFRQSAERLSSNGHLLVIANRHLPYLGVLKRYFRDVHSTGSDPRFSVYRCQSPRAGQRD